MLVLILATRHLSIDRCKHADESELYRVVETLSASERLDWVGLGRKCGAGTLHSGAQAESTWSEG